MDLLDLLDLLARLVRIPGSLDPGSAEKPEKFGAERVTVRPTGAPTRNLCFRGVDLDESR